MAGRRYIAIRRLILLKCNEKKVLARMQASDTLSNKVRTEVVRHSTLQCFQVKFNYPRIRVYWAFQASLDTLIMDVLKKAAESGRDARLNPDAKEEEGAAGGGDASRDERAVACPQPSFHEE